MSCRAFNTHSVLLVLPQCTPFTSTVVRICSCGPSAHCTAFITVCHSDCPSTACLARPMGICISIFASPAILTDSSSSTILVSRTSGTFCSSCRCRLPLLACLAVVIICACSCCIYWAACALIICTSISCLAIGTVFAYSICGKFPDLTGYTTRHIGIWCCVFSTCCAFV